MPDVSLAISKYEEVFPGCSSTSTSTASTSTASTSTGSTSSKLAEAALEPEINEIILAVDNNWMRAMRSQMLMTKILRSQATNPQLQLAAVDSTAGRHVATCRTHSTTTYNCISPHTEQACGLKAKPLSKYWWEQEDYAHTESTAGYGCRSTAGHMNGSETDEPLNLSVTKFQIKALDLSINKPRFGFWNAIHNRR